MLSTLQHSGAALPTVLPSALDSTALLFGETTRQSNRDHFLVQLFYSHGLSPANAPPSTSQPTVLIIEDNERNLYLATFLLERKGCKIISACDGLVGLSSARDELPDLVVLDIQLPEMDGYEVAAKLRELPQLSKTPIMAVTSHAMPGDKEKALRAGCNGYLEKPIDPLTFADDVLALLKEFAQDRVDP